MKHVKTSKNRSNLHINIGHHPELLKNKQSGKYGFPNKSVTFTRQTVMSTYAMYM